MVDRWSAFVTSTVLNLSLFNITCLLRLSELTTSVPLITLTNTKSAVSKYILLQVSALCRADSGVGALG